MHEKKMINSHPFIHYTKQEYSREEMEERSSQFLSFMNKRRSVRHFSDKPVSRDVIDNIICTASTAPSGANRQPWTFCVVSNPGIKKIIREAAEKEEYESYHSRMNDDWLNDLAPLQTDWKKPFLEKAPYLIIVFRRSYDIGKDKKKQQNYYVNESCGIACGFLLAAIHHAGLAALTHTPSPMNFLSKILGRPENEKPFLLIPVGYVAEECYVPDIPKKSLEDVCVYYS